MNKLLQRIFGPIMHRMMGPPSCQELNTFLTDYLEGELPEDTATKYRKHLEKCPPCGAYFDQYQQTIDLARECRDAELPPDLVEHTLEFLRANRG
ncbi:MAG: zf-HC2 domain-containing protein [Rhodothermales bacterium]|nr:zf-HC2 domain-containing protein [Rhodothermales bacterium]MBO6780147.1 zf-HC2 domain-containing protein [Rhodothermales bacterium]